MRRVNPILLLAFACSASTSYGVPRVSSDETEVVEKSREPTWIAPRTEEAIAKGLRANGGNASTEKGVMAGLDWLARHQNGDGGWDSDGFSSRCDPDGSACDGIGKGQHGEEIPCPFDAAISSLALLAFLGHGHLPDASDASQDRYGPIVDNAIEYVRVNANGTWSLPLALQAIAEAEVLCHDGRYLPDVEELAAELLSKRQPDGGFGYAAPYREGSDVPYTALAVQGLVAARDAGIELPQDFAEGIDHFLAALEETKGELAYLRDGRKYGYTPTSTNGHLAAAIREILPINTTGSRHRDHLALLAKNRPLWKISFRTVDVPGRGEMEVQVGRLSMYQWWYGSIASFQRGGSAWSVWHSAVKKALVGEQRRDGCAVGSFDPVGTYERQTGGRVFSTALGVLMLEQPYLHRRR